VGDKVAHRRSTVVSVVPVPRPGRTYVVYVDDSGSEHVGLLWSGLALPFDLWAEYLRRWLAFRRWLYQEHAIPARFELHAQVWLSADPGRNTPEEQLALVGSGALPAILQRDRSQRRARFEAFEKGLKTIGTFTDALIFSTFESRTDGAAKAALYDDLLVFIDEYLRAEGAYATLIVDGTQDGGGHRLASHRALSITTRRIVEDAGMRSSADSQLLQMADWIAYAAFQSIQDKESFDVRFRRQYERQLSRLLARPFGVDEGRCIRGWDYPAAAAVTL
jgi:hypothetical protein